MKKKSINVNLGTNLNEADAWVEALVDNAVEEIEDSQVFSGKEIG